MNTKNKAHNVNLPFRSTGSFPIDAKSIVGESFLYKTIDDLVNAGNDSMLENGMVVNDANYGVTWQIYKEGTEWKYRLLNGMFYVDAVATSHLDVTVIDVLSEIDGVTGVEGNIVLCVNEFDPEDNGIWVMSEEGWYRHPIFDETSTQLSGVHIRIKDGTKYKNSIWLLSNYGDITIGTDSIYFEQLLIQTDTNDNSVTSAVKYSNFNNSTDQRITLGSNLVPGQEYIIRKTSDNDNAIVLVTPTTLNYVGTLNKKDDWIKFIPTTGASIPDDWFIMFSNQRTLNGIAYFFNAPTGDIYLDKSNVYYYNGVNASGGLTNLHLPIDCYDDFVYHFHLEGAWDDPSSDGATSLYDYDGNLLAYMDIDSSGDGDFFFKPADTKYCTAKNTATENAELKIKIPRSWKLKDLIINHTPSTTEAEATVTFTDSPTNGDTITVGDEVFTFGAFSSGFTVQSGGSASITGTRFAARVNAASSYVTASNDAGVVTLTAKDPYLGVFGNDIDLSEDADNTSVSGANLTGGLTEYPTATPVTINIGTTSGGNDLVDAVEIPSEDVTTIAINKVLSFEEDKILFVSSSSWGSTSIEIMATRKGTIK
jgi:hypothetical protein